MCDVLGYKNFCSMCKNAIESEKKIVCDNKKSRFYGEETQSLLLAPCMSRNEVKVYDMDDYDWWISNLTPMATMKSFVKNGGYSSVEEYLKELDLDIGDTAIELDLDKEGMWVGPTEDEIRRCEYKKDGERAKFNDLYVLDGVKIFLPLREAIKRVGYKGGAEFLASTEW